MIGLERKTLKSDRLEYRLLCPSDTEELFAILSDRSVTEPAGFLPAPSREAFNEFFAQLTQYRTAVAILREGTLMGYLRVNKYVPDGPEYAGKSCVSTGFVIGKQYQNRGYATETLKTLTAYLKQFFAACFADHFAGNEPSRRVIEKCGYRFYEEYTMFFDELGKDIACRSYVF